MRTIVNLNPTPEFRAFEEVFERLIGTPSRPTTQIVHSLPVDITEYDSKFYIRAAVPGVNPEELDIQIEKNVLTIRGELKSINQSADEKVYRREVSYGAFARSIRLPEGLDLSAVSADFANGIVSISIPRLPEEKPQSVKVNVRTMVAESAPLPENAA